MLTVSYEAGLGLGHHNLGMPIIQQPLSNYLSGFGENLFSNLYFISTPSSTTFPGLANILKLNQLKPSVHSLRFGVLAYINHRVLSLCWGLWGVSALRDGGSSLRIHVRKWFRRCLGTFQMLTFVIDLGDWHEWTAFWAF